VIPRERAARVEWFYAQWVRVDEWVGRNLEARDAGRLDTSRPAR
jgi:hypothetical protein